MSRTAATSSGINVIKIGGSTLGNHDTSLDDIAALHAEGERIMCSVGQESTNPVQCLRYDIGERR